MLGDQALEHSPPRSVEHALIDQNIGHRPRLVTGPRVECREERPLLDKTGLDREQPKEQVAINVDLRHQWRSQVSNRTKLGILPAASRLIDLDLTQPHKPNDPNYRTSARSIPSNVA